MTEPSNQVQAYMTICPHSVGLEQPAKLAREMMRKFGVRHLPVQSGGKLVGVVSDRDIKFAAAYSRDHEESFTMEDIYTPEPFIVKPDTSVAEIAKRMAEDKIGCALVVANDKLVGIFTTTDACRVLAEILG